MTDSAPITKKLTTFRLLIPLIDLNIRFSLVTLTILVDLAVLTVLKKETKFDDKIESNDTKMRTKSNIFQSSSKYFSMPNPTILIIASKM